MAIERRATVTITISVKPELAEIARRAVESTKYRNVSHFAECAMLHLAAHDDLIK